MITDNTRLLIVLPTASFEDFPILHQWKSRIISAVFC